MKTNMPIRYHQKSEEILSLALEKVPAYASWNSAVFEGSADERYSALPSLTKEDLRFHGWEGFIPAEMNAAKALEKGLISLVKTSGTTAEQVVNVWYQPWWDRSERLSWTLNDHFSGLRYGEEAEAILTGPLNIGHHLEGRDLSFGERRLDRFLYLNERSGPLYWDDAFMDRMLTELKEFKPAILEANPSYLARLALYAWRTGREVWQPRVIVLTYENARPLAREHISRVFTSPVVSSFGSTETAYVFMECEAGGLHQNWESCRVDVRSLSPEFDRPDLGHVLVTTFDNDWRVLVRFDTGDLVRLETSCPCGRNHGLIASEIVGRTTDLTFASDGRTITPIEVDKSLCGVEDLTSYRLEQPGKGVYCVEVEAVGGSVADEVRERLAALYRPVDIRVTAVDGIRTLPSGKYRYTSAAKARDPDFVCVG